MERREDKAFWKGGGRKDQAKLFSGGRGLVYGSMGGLVLLLGLMLLPITPVSSSALGENETMTVGLNTKTTAYLYSTITLSTSGQVDIDIVPRSTGALGIGTAEVKVSTNNTTGYSMFLSTVDGTNQLNQIDSNLQYSGETKDYYIDTLKQATTADSYLTNTQNLNTWGYALTSEAASGSTEYRGMTSTTGDQIYTTKGTSSNDSYNLNLAVAVDTTLPAGGYRNGLVITAVANPIILSGFNQIYYMQDMTPAVCESAEMESTAQLVDRRDNKLYWVAKLKDGNCWMVQNLALNLGSNPNNGSFGTSGENSNEPYVAKLTPEDSDVGENYVPASINPLFSTNAVGLEEIPTHAFVFSQFSWNLGNLLLATPLLGNSCGEKDPSPSTTFNLAETCAASGIIDISRGAWTPTYEAKAMELDSDGRAIFIGTNSIRIDITNSNLVAIKPNDPNDLTKGGEYDPHYLLGNYYQANTATAGTRSTADKGAEASSSICSKGWQLPTSGKYIDGDLLGQPMDKEKSYYRLLLSYGYPKASDYSSGSTAILSPNMISESNIYSSPLSMVRSGIINMYGVTSVADAGGVAYYWASTASSTTVTDTYALYSGKANISPVVAYDRFGFSVRCVAK